MSYNFISYVLLFLIIYGNKKKERIKKLVRRGISISIAGHNRKDTNKMIDLAKQFIGKDVYVYTIDENEFGGVLKQVTNDALLLELEDNTLEVVNIEYVIRFREHPRDKKGKKKFIVTD